MFTLVDTSPYFSLVNMVPKVQKGVASMFDLHESYISVLRKMSLSIESKSFSGLITI